MLPPAACPGPLSRRHFLRLGALTLGAVGFHGLQPLRLRAQGPAKDTAVIFIWLPGGPPHMETYDLKPDAPDEYRGEFKPIKTVVPGIEVCEHLPMHAKVADRFTLIRSIAHTFADHGGGHKKFLTGRDPREPTGFVNDHPMVGSYVPKFRPERPDGVPVYVAGTDGGRDHIDVFSFGAAYLGQATHPFTVAGDPSEPNFAVRNLAPVGGQDARFRDRLGLLRNFDYPPAGLDAETVDGIDAFRERAVHLLTTDAARKAFDLNREPAAVRERYGLHRYGQRCLLARRLVEAGVTFVTMVLENPSPPGGSFPKDVTYNWDSHAVNCHLFTDCKYRFPFYDRAITALIEDLYARGLDRRVLLIATGEFGRTPRINSAEGRPGRDHWPQAMSVLVSGGGFRTGQVIGSTNSRGEHPKDRPLTPNDLWATMFQHLGVDYNASFLDHTGRPMPVLPDGAPIAELG